MAVARPSSDAASGRFAPGGGIMPACSLRIIFSPSGAWSVMLASLNSVSVSWPLRDFSLWQPVQNCETTASGSSDAAGAFGPLGTACDACPACALTGASCGPAGPRWACPVPA